MTTARLMLLYLIVAAHARIADAADTVWIIGGGADIDSGGVQIERTASRVIEAVRTAPGTRSVHVVFGDGDDPGKDIVEWTKPTDADDRFQPIARVFGNHVANGNRYRSHAIPQVRGSTRRETLLETLRGDFRALEADDRALIIYLGHGLESEVDAADNTLHLWGDTQVSAREFESLLREIRPTVQTRFLFAQCYSGGFARLIHPDADDVLALAHENRCGFLAAAEDQESEGCSPNTSAGSYRDYPTDFFAALTSEQPAGAGVDMDGDGRSGLFDAHLSALVTGFSRSVPRATSETYLEKWQPWYLRWIDSRSDPDNFYSVLFERVRSDLGLPTHDGERRAEIDRRLTALRDRIDELDAERARSRDLSEAVSARIAADVGERWPESRHPYTSQYLDFLQRDLDAASAFIVSHDEYATLVEMQDRLLQIEDERLIAERSVVDIEKVLRLRRLARIYDQFQSFASEDERRDYAALRSCEAAPL